jgi:hypothetical protein
VYHFRLRNCLVVLAIVCRLGSVAASAEDRACTNSTLRGNFAFTAQGTTLAALGLPPAITGPFSSIGEANFDGDGPFTLTAVSSFNGMVQGPDTVTGAYSVERRLLLYFASEQWSKL